MTFGADVAGILFASHWLQRPIECADATLHPILTKAIREAGANGPMSFTEQVQGVLHQMVLSGTASADAVARLFGVNKRTLRQRLNEDGKNLLQPINETRSLWRCLATDLLETGTEMEVCPEPQLHWA